MATDDEEWLQLAKDVAARPTPGKGTAAAKGAVQGATLGFGDELQAGLETVVSKIPGVRSVFQALQHEGAPDISDPSLTYQQRRDHYRGIDQEAREAHPKTFLAGELAGGFAVPGGGAGGIGRAVARGVATGAVSGVGHSEASDVGSIVEDAGRGAAVGAGAGLVGHGLGKVVAGAGKRVDKRNFEGIVEDAKDGIRRGLWAKKDELQTVLRADDGLRKAVGSPDKILGALETRFPATKAAADRIYAATPRIAPPDVLGPLNQVRNAMVKGSVDSAQVRAVDKVIGELRGGLARDPKAGIAPAELRAWLSSRLSPGPRPLDKMSGEVEKAEAAAAVAVRAALHGHVEKHAGPAAARELEALNARMNVYGLLESAAKEAAFRQGGGRGVVGQAVEAVKGGVRINTGAAIGGAVAGLPGAVVGGVAQGAMSRAVGPADRMLATPAGQAVGQALTPHVPPAMSQPVIDALTTKDREAGKAALMSEIFGP